MLKKLYYLIPVVAIVAIVGITIANIIIPICSRSVAEEDGLRFTSNIIPILILGPLLISIFVSTKSRKEALSYIPLVILAFFSCAPVFWSSMHRKHQLDIEYFSFDGYVVEKYVSRNHAAKSLTIGGVNYESIPRHVWNQIDVRDRVKKSSCSSTIEINGNEVRFGRD
ncbi:MAG: hypothetical protein GY820_10915 [Gammaproteobacteria bacterium]|nr:hypothetical protein [Gammaproteobacteria bacterium]